MDVGVVLLEPTVHLSRTNLHLAAGFSCVAPGEKEAPWDEDARHWITAQPTKGGAIDDVELLDYSVWLYLDENQNIMGFASLGEDFRYPKAKERAQKLPHVALHYTAKGNGTGKRVLAWILWEARRRLKEDGAPAELVLDVDPNNGVAKGMYERRGFKPIHEMKDDPRKWIVMSLHLGDAPEAPPG